MNARDVVLNAVRAALADDGGARTPPSIPVHRGYRTATEVARGSAAALDILEERLVDYRATVVRCTPHALGAAIVEQLAPGAPVVVPAGLPEAWTAALAEWDGGVVVDDPTVPLSPSVLNACGTVLTGCRVAVADTGTVVLDAGPDQGRRALTLVPDRHVCVVRQDQVVAAVPEAVRLLERHPERPLTWISGPSATSDIELVRVEGVHGPRDLRVVLMCSSEG